MKLTRRELLKTGAATAVATTLPASLSAFAKTSDIRWGKAPCRFCGAGCSVLVGTQDGSVVATQADPESPVNRGLNCVKGYALPKIMYGADRLTEQRSHAAKLPNSHFLDRVGNTYRAQQTSSSTK